MIKAIAAALVGAIAGVLMVFAWSAAFALVMAFMLGFILDPFLAIIDVPFLTERFSGLGFGQLFMLVFAIRLLAGVFLPGKPDTKTGGGP